MRLILAHDYTDFDAVASQLGAWKLDGQAVPVTSRQINRNVRDFLTLHWDALPFVRGEALPDETTIESILLVDTQTLPIIKGLELETAPSVRVIDHHPPRPDSPSEWDIELHTIGSCATLFIEQLQEQQVALTWVEATLLLLGVHEDTGSLTYNNTTARDGYAAAWLLAQGADLDTLRHFLDVPLSDKQRTLYRRLLEQSEFIDIHGATVLVAQAVMESYVEDISALSRSLNELYDPAALFMVVEMVEDDHSKVQVVARSATDDINVDQVMSHLGGGGHVRAASAFVDNTTAAEVATRLRHILTIEIEPAITVGDLMSWGNIRTLSPQTRIGEAAALMARWGHEGFPVVEDGQVVGVLTRRDVDRALQHQLENAPIPQFMHKGHLVVTPQDSIAGVQKVMTTANIGQVPVVAPETGAVIGIITRTDLLKRIERSRQTPTPPDYRPAVRAALPLAAWAIVERIVAEATAIKYRPYLVGGPVRDILLQRPVRDIDIVFEGAAIPLAWLLARTLGGRVVTHERFGTAKWLLRDPDFPPKDDLLRAAGLPDFIDLITARTEFYDRPTALPDVSHASIKQDLHRRDFTINTLAIALGGRQAGQLLDFYGGVSDLENKLIRVLHNLSFVEDPTRILRAIRFEQRFGFTLEPRTAELLTDSLDLLTQVSPDRLRHEFLLMVAEANPAQILARLHERAVLPYLFPGGAWSEATVARLDSLQTAGEKEGDAWVIALMWDATRPRLEEVGQRLGLLNSWRERLLTLHTLRQQEPALSVPELANSALDALLQKVDPRAIELFALLTDNETLRTRLRFYLNDLRHRRLAVTGDDLRAAGLNPGRHYQTILNKLRAALLEGMVTDEASQREMLGGEVERYKRGL